MENKKIEKKATVYQKLLQVQSELTVGKERFNEYGKFKYRTCEDILTAVKPLLKKQGLLLLCSDKIVIIETATYLEATAELIDIDSAENIKNTAYARLGYDFKNMSLSQMTGATSSYARKYALNGLFCISDVDPDEMDNKKDTSAKKVDAKSNVAKADIVTQEQLNELKSLGVSIQDFCEYKKIEKITDISKQEMSVFLSSLQKKRARNRASSEDNATADNITKEPQHED